MFTYKEENDVFCCKELTKGNSYHRKDKINFFVPKKKIGVNQCQYCYICFFSLIIRTFLSRYGSTFEKKKKNILIFLLSNYSKSFVKYQYTFNCTRCTYHTHIHNILLSVNFCTFFKNLNTLITFSIFSNYDEFVCS